MTYDFTAAAAHFAARNAFTTGPHELSGVLDRKEEVVVLDLRFPSDFRHSHVPGAINLPKGKWEKAGADLAKDKLHVLYCYDATCHLAAEAAGILVAQGIRVQEMEGGFAAWEAKSLPIVTAAPKAA